MLSKEDQLRARFAEGDLVAFPLRRRTAEGVVVRLNPKRAVVRISGDDFTVPYALLTPLSDNAERRVERIESVLRLALELMAQHGLKGWQFRFDHSTRRAGCCSYRDKRITLAFDLARTGSDEAIRDTILHEIAHALVGRKHHHDAVWKAQARAIGGSGERTHRLQFAPPRWSVTCENRCWTQTAQQRNSQYVCRKCGGKLVYTPYSAAGF
ncbi:SprT-like domain-containing protein [Pontiella sp.]|uniref:SprT family zinc-dependent metalloprotease n=1 Tax=Pontiella sp. TaxID=2837462 RepID=UPI003566CC73